MEISKLECPSCGAGIKEANGRALCDYCGREVVIVPSRPAEISIVHADPPPSSLQSQLDRAPENAAFPAPGRVGNAKSQAFTFFLAFFFGFLGAHRFYTGHTKLGLLYLFTMGGFGIGWAVDILLLLFNAYKDSDGRPLTPMGSLGMKIILVLLGGTVLLSSWIQADPNAPAIALLVSFAIPLALVNLKKISKLFSKWKDPAGKGS